MTGTQPVIYTNASAITNNRQAFKKHGLTKFALKDKQFSILKKKAERGLTV